jgi:hypothetical protein
MAYVQQSGSATTARVPKGKFKAEGTSKELIKENADRIALIITNPTTKNVFLSLGTAAASGEGIFLKKEGGAWENTVYLGSVFVISEEGEANICYAEV